MELRGYRRANKPIGGLFSSHYFSRYGGESQFTGAPLPARRRPITCPPARKIRLRT